MDVVKTFPHFSAVTLAKVSQKTISAAMLPQSASPVDDTCTRCTGARLHVPPSRRSGSGGQRGCTTRRISCRNYPLGACTNPDLSLPDNHRELTPYYPFVQRTWSAARDTVEQFLDDLRGVTSSEDTVYLGCFILRDCCFCGCHCVWSDEAFGHDKTAKLPQTYTNMCR